MIELDTGLFYDPIGGTVVKAVDDNHCSLYPRGSNPMDGGFLLNRPALEVALDLAEELEDVEVEDD